ncbi:hypothetical protein BCR33DRAFT_859802 [Rhizoclosmatium globosum]|uniref:BZIP domain-containing protein n=1 Tax=Rhizoclosmatium globosum TaxID=329046 RepID=A0A1Y2ASM1_9FUNG|nr:hypothetical protein BCR33DRAFT_859802 [Rhizoclosmatium globosum]|eukprot:ORY25486.1 hypothetical protein BCR33DRAFT_859802 [Rhizoclosmatium globosum]
MPPKQKPSLSKASLNKTGPSPRRQRQNREAQKRYREKRNRLYHDLERRYAELTNSSNSCGIAEVGYDGTGTCFDCGGIDEVEIQSHQLTQLQVENMTLAAMLQQSDLFEANAWAAAEEVHHKLHHLPFNVPPAAEPQKQHHPHEAHEIEDVVSDEIVWEDLLNFLDSSNLDPEDDALNKKTMQKDVEATKLDLGKVPSLRECSDLIDQFTNLVLSADDLFRTNQHQKAMENVRKVVDMKITLVDQCITEVEKNETLRIVNELRDKRVKPIVPVPKDLPTTFNHIPGLETREATKLLDEIIVHLLEPESVSEVSNLVQLKRKIMDMVSSDTHKEKALALLHLHGFPHDL